MRTVPQLEITMNTVTATPSPFTTAAKTAGNIVVATGVGVAAGMYTVGAVIQQAGLLATRTLCFAGREAVRTHAPMVAINAKGAHEVATSAFEAAIVGESAIDAAKQQAVAQYAVISAEQADLIAKSFDFGF